MKPFIQQLPRSRNPYSQVAIRASALPVLCGFDVVAEVAYGSCIKLCLQCVLQHLRGRVAFVFIGSAAPGCSRAFMYLFMFTLLSQWCTPHLGSLALSLLLLCMGRNVLGFPSVIIMILDISITLIVTMICSIKMPILVA